MKKTGMPVVALLSAILLAACTTTSPEVADQLDAQSDRLAQLEQQLDEVNASLREMQSSESMEDEHEGTEPSAFDIAIAQYVMDIAGFHAIDDALAETGEIDLSTVSTVARVARVVGSTQWPDDLSDRSTHFIEMLVEFQSALEDNDVDGATSTSSKVHGLQHEFSAAISTWLSGEMSMEVEHEHEDD
ncbi:MAG: hypothetical protein ACE5JF_08535 [Anaerolineales bacterium]